MSAAETLPVIYQDEHLIAINKPSGLLVHRSEIDRHETRFALQIIRDQIGQRVYPVHRLDKPTSGVLVFALNPDAARSISSAIETKCIRKTYHAVVRGYAPENGHIDHALKEELDKYTDKKAKHDKAPQSAQTNFRRLATIELPVEIEHYPQSRYSLVECQPLTGRKHQIRRHMKHINHPVIGDAKHGRGRHNRYFKSELNAGRLLLHASQMQLPHPVSGALLSLSAAPDDAFLQLLERFDWLGAFSDATDELPAWANTTTDDIP
ncbi:tRNA pseudouridine(65) synthase TruC [Aestuariicella hydrocarbonica]|uniref:tRNA pseudouridine synthase C n=1 Tax=Pseudomaricurvus hydrocarbonicus TaxID=1470433 RepID=A0A9E5MKH5_9GAMM|nr:tRNA pseudouridine(65) synthase TruC [Aestuariicella hydrocarbonica]NHO65392.1 tRNA pseudouridine(65) synthase TruC [Aestuariicella hydrocarbonica]